MRVDQYRLLLECLADMFTPAFHMAATMSVASWAYPPPLSNGAGARVRVRVERVARRNSIFRNQHPDLDDC